MKNAKHLTTKILLLLSLLFSLSLFGQIDISVSPRNNYVLFGRGMLWTGSGLTNNVPNINNNFLIGSILPDTGLCVYIYNNDSSAHSFNMLAYETGDPGVITFANNSSKWQQLNTGFFSQTVAATSLQTNFIKTAGAARIAIVVNSGSGTGNADMYAVITTAGGCANDAYSLTNALNSGEANSYQNGQLRTVQACAVNPGAGAVIVDIAANASTTARVFFKKARYSTTAAGQINVDTINSLGTGCGTPNNGFIGQNTSSIGSTTTQSACVTTQPGIQSLLVGDQVAANTPTEFDLTGGIANNTNYFGVGVFTPASITGTVCATIEYWLK